MYLLGMDALNRKNKETLQMNIIKGIEANNDKNEEVTADKLATVDQ